MPIEKVTISRIDTIYEFDPDMVYLPKGKIICIYRESDGHAVKEFSRIVTRSSLDGGHTWSDRQVIVEAYPNEDGVVLKWNAPRIQQLKDGRLLASCDVLPVPPNEKTDLTNAQIVFWWSEDDGETWSDPVYTPIFGIMPDKLIELPSGAWLLATHVRKKLAINMIFKGNLTQTRPPIRRSGEATWEGPYIVGQDERYNLCEASIMLLPDGELVCYMRENSGSGIACVQGIFQR